MQELKEIAIELYNIDALKFGEFITKVGLKTPIYFDLRVIIAHPPLLQRISRALWKFSENSSSVSQICGVPYTALPLATVISTDSGIPMLIKRKEAKGYGTKKLIEGKFKVGDHCVIIEDVVTSGSSILETVKVLQDEGLKATETFVVIDREQGGRKHLEDNGIQMKSLYTVSQLMQYLLEANKVSAEMVKSVSDYTKSCQASIASIKDTNVRLKQSFHERASQATNPIASKILQLMESKQSTLCLAVDLTKSDVILELADSLGPHIVVLKTHVDIIEDFDQSFVKRLKELAKKHSFLLMEDRKFGDIGNTVSLQYRRGLYKIAEWADIVTVHSVAGSSTIDGLKDGLKGIAEPRGIFLVTQMSSKNALTNANYIENSVNVAKSSDLVIGHVCQENIFAEPGLIQLTPGVKLCKSTDNLGQQYNTPDFVVSQGADLIVVGRGITEARDKLSVTLDYKRELWAAYQRRINKSE